MMESSCVLRLCIFKNLMELVTALHKPSASKYDRIRRFIPVSFFYVNYSNIAAKVLRQSLKADLKVEAAKRNESSVTISFWSDGVKLAHGQKPKAEDSPKASKT